MENVAYSEQQEPKQERGKQDACSRGGCTLPEQTYSTRQRDEGAEIDQYLACGQTLGYRLPYRGEIAFYEAQDSEADHGRRKDRMTHTRDAHRPILRWGISSSGTGILVCQIPGIAQGNWHDKFQGRRCCDLVSIDLATLNKRAKLVILCPSDRTHKPRFSWYNLL